jgi:hypothetical protein
MDFFDVQIRNGDSALAALPRDILSIIREHFIMQCNSALKTAVKQHTAINNFDMELLHDILCVGTNYQQICSLSRTHPHIITPEYRKVYSAVNNRLYHDTGILPMYLIPIRLNRPIEWMMNLKLTIRINRSRRGLNYNQRTVVEKVQYLRNHVSTRQLIHQNNRRNTKHNRFSNSSCRSKQLRFRNKYR